MKIIPKPLRAAARDSIVGSIIGVVSFSIIIILFYVFLYLVGYIYNFEKYIMIFSVIAVIITAVGTTANAYRERKMKKDELVKRIIVDNRCQLMEQTRMAMANLYAAERTCIDIAKEKEVDTHKIIEDINLYVSQLILYLPNKENVLCDEVRCLARDVKAVKKYNNGSAGDLLCRIRAQENKCQVFLKSVWKNIKSEVAE